MFCFLTAFCEVFFFFAFIFSNSFANPTNCGSDPKIDFDPRIPAVFWECLSLIWFQFLFFVFLILIIFFLDDVPQSASVNSGDSPFVITGMWDQVSSIKIYKNIKKKKLKPVVNQKLSLIAKFKSWNFHVLLYSFCLNVVAGVSLLTFEMTTDLIALLNILLFTLFVAWI